MGGKLPILCLLSVIVAKLVQNQVVYADKPVFERKYQKASKKS